MQFLVNGRVYLQIIVFLDHDVVRENLDISLEKIKSKDLYLILIVKSLIYQYSKNILLLYSEKMI